MTTKSHTSGFTLIETIIYLALFTIVIGGIVVAAYAMFENADRNQAKAMLQDEQNFVMAKIALAMNNGQIINVPGNNLSGSSLYVTRYDAGIAQICLSGTDVKILLSSGTCATAGTVLNNANVTVDQLLFEHVHDASTNADSIIYTTTISTKASNGMTLTQSASSTKYIRK
jgi:type II secretory pathway pseudopilin PulG